MLLLKEVSTSLTLYENIRYFSEHLNQDYLLTETAERTLGQAFARLRNGDTNINEPVVFGFLLLADVNVREAFNVTKDKLTVLSNYNDSDEQKVNRYLNNLVNHPSLKSKVEELKRLKQQPDELANKIGKARMVYASIGK